MSYASKELSFWGSLTYSFEWFNCRSPTCFMHGSGRTVSFFVDGQTNTLLRNCDYVVVFQPDRYSSMVLWWYAKCRPPKNSRTCWLGSGRTHNSRRYSIFTSLNDNDNETFRDNNNDNDNMLKSLGVCRLGSVRTHNPRCCIFQEFLCSWQCRFSSGFRSKRLTQS